MRGGKFLLNKQYRENPKNYPRAKMSMYTVFALI